MDPQVGSHNTWRDLWAFSRSRWLFIIVICVLLLIAAFLPTFFDHLEQVPGVLMADPVLDRLPAVDLSVPMFTLLYGMLLWVLISVLNKPMMLLQALLAYGIMLLLRIVTMTMLPLAEPDGLVALTDPISQLFYPGDVSFTRDLFFSGHVATATILALSRTGWQRVAFIIGTLVIATMLLLQHVHYTIDVLVAPFAALLAWWLASRIILWAGPSRISPQRS